MEVLKDNDILVINSIQHQDQNTFADVVNAANARQLQIEMDIYDSEVNYLIQTIYSSSYSFANGEIQFIAPTSADNANGGSIQINTEKILRRYNYSSGNFSVRYKFYTNILGSNIDSEKVFIDAISPTRQEISIQYTDDEALDTFKSISEKYFPQYSQDFSFDKYVNFGGDNLFLALNAKNQFDDSTKEYSLIIKLYEPLPDTYDINSKLWLVMLYSDEITDTLTLYDTRGQGGITVIRPPNFEGLTERVTKPSSTYVSYNDLVLNAQNYNLSDIYHSYIVNSSSLYGIDLNIDYSNFKNFVHFGSATQMLQNFQGKLQSIESFNSDLSLIGVTSSYAASSSLTLTNQRSDIFKKFTRFEKFMYFETGSYFTSPSVTTTTLPYYAQAPYNSFMATDELGNLLIDTTYPKQNINVIPYIVFPTTSSVAIAWFSTMMSASVNFDWNNRDWLIYTVPEYIRLDSDANQDYLTFINMVGEFYDNIWTYIENYYRLIKRENNLQDAISSDLIWNILQNDGLTLNNSGEAVNLSSYFSGISISGSSSNFTASLINAEKDITHEVWNRILNSLPTLYKSKGTERSIRTLLNCYGIPTNYVSIIEFGGPYSSSYSDTSISGTYGQSYQFELEDFTHLVNVQPTQYISVPWQTSSFDSEVPDSIEFKFSTKYPVTKQILLEKSSSVLGSGSFNLTLNKSNYPNLGYLQFTLYSGSVNTPTASITTKNWPFYNGDVYSVLLERNDVPGNNDAPSTSQTYTLILKKYSDSLQKITVTDIVTLPVSTADANTAWIGHGYINLGSSNANGASASFDEFRVWSETLNPYIFDWHTKYSSATNGNSLTSSLGTLAFRLSFNAAINLGASKYLPNEGYASASYVGGAYATASNFVSSLVYPYSYTPMDRYNLVSTMYTSPSIASDQKIRLENNQVSQSITLSDNYVVRPLRLPINSNYQNLIYDYSSNQYIPIAGEASSFDDTDNDSTRLLIAFTPTQLMNNDIIAFYGGDASLFDYGDPANYYSESYPSTDYLKRMYVQNTKNYISFYSYISFIRMYNQSFFEQIRNFVPANADLTMGTIYEPTILNRSKIQLIRPETATNYRQRNVIIQMPQKSDPIGTMLPDLVTQIETITFPDISALANDVYVAFMIEDEIIDISATQGILFAKMAPIDIYQLSGNFEEYTADCYYTFNPWQILSPSIYSFNENTKKYYGYINKCTSNWSGLTPDRRPAVEINRNSGKQLRVNFSDSPKLIVQ